MRSWLLWLLLELLLWPRLELLVTGGSLHAGRMLLALTLKLHHRTRTSLLEMHVVVIADRVVDHPRMITKWTMITGRMYLVLLGTRVGLLRIKSVVLLWFLLLFITFH